MFFQLLVQLPDPAGHLGVIMRGFQAMIGIRVHIDQIFHLADLAFGHHARANEQLIRFRHFRGNRLERAAIRTPDGLRAALQQVEGQFRFAVPAGVQRDGKLHIHRQVVLFGQAGQDGLQQRHKAAAPQEAIEGQDQLFGIEIQSNRQGRAHGFAIVHGGHPAQGRKIGTQDRHRPAGWQVHFFPGRADPQNAGNNSGWSQRVPSGRNCGWLRLTMRG